MTKREFLLKRFNEMIDDYYAHQEEFHKAPATSFMEPFKIADGLYYVGDTRVCIHLIDTGDGLILLDSGFPESQHLLIESIWRAGFNPKDVRWIIHTHGHYDHFGASEEFRRLYGTKLAISRTDAEALREKPTRGHVNNELYPYLTVPTFDYEIEDGEIFEHGNTKIRCVLTPGHTIGVLTFFFEVTYSGNTYLAGLLGGAGTRALTLPYQCYNEDPEDVAYQMLAAIEKIWNEPVMIHLGNHPENNQTLPKREKQLEEGGNPFVDAQSWHDFLNDLKANINRIIASNEALEKELNERFSE
ncbi:MAG: MBL fold metallo-hydrolase [Ruminococcaceae bacterium]|nr:MBL fold metallo-hydrolase [Oscillospiraceae bacterium]